MSYLARYSGRTHDLYAMQLRRWFSGCEANDLDPLIGIQRAHVELHIRQLGESGLQDSSVVTMMHGIRGFFRFAHLDGTIRLRSRGLLPTNFRFVTNLKFEGE
ncbi:MAG: site-specific integrase [Nocardioides sp.]